MSINPDISKQAHEIILSCKKSIVSHPPLNFNSIPVAQANFPQNLRMQIDKKFRRTS